MPDRLSTDARGLKLYLKVKTRERTEKRKAQRLESIFDKTEGTLVGLKNPLKEEGIRLGKPGSDPDKFSNTCDGLLSIYRKASAYMRDRAVAR